MTEEISLAEWRKLQKQPHKYGARAVVVDGHRFDSHAEAARYSDLLLLQSGDQIADLRLQPRYVLQDAFRDQAGKRYAAISYVADFAYTEVATQHQVVEDVKGLRTAVYLLKAKLFRCKYPQLEYRVLEVSRRLLI
jgi:hypothetical protein